MSHLTESRVDGDEVNNEIGSSFMRNFHLLTSDSELPLTISTSHDGPDNSIFEGIRTPRKFGTTCVAPFLWRARNLADGAYSRKFYESTAAANKRDQTPNHSMHFITLKEKKNSMCKKLRLKPKCTTYQHAPNRKLHLGCHIHHRCLTEKPTTQAR